MKQSADHAAARPRARTRIIGNRRPLLLLVGMNLSNAHPHSNYAVLAVYWRLRMLEAVPAYDNCFRERYTYFASSILLQTFHSSDNSGYQNQFCITPSKTHVHEYLMTLRTNILSHTNRRFQRSWKYEVDYNVNGKWYEWISRSIQALLESATQEWSTRQKSKADVYQTWIKINCMQICFANRTGLSGITWNISFETVLFLIRYSLYLSIFSVQ